VLSVGIIFSGKEKERNRKQGTRSLSKKKAKPTVLSVIE